MSATNDLNKQIETLGNLRGGKFWRNNSGGRYMSGRFVHFGLTGSGDILGCYRGFFVSIETKIGADKASADQVQFAQDIQECGGFAIFAKSLEDAERLFDQIDSLVSEREADRKIAKMAEKVMTGLDLSNSIDDRRHSMTDSAVNDRPG